MLCTIGAARAVYASQNWGAAAPSQIRDGAFIAYLHGTGLKTPVTVIDDRYFMFDHGGAPNRRYNPIVDFYARLYSRDWQITQLNWGQAPAPASMVIACSPAALSWARAHYRVTISIRHDGCVLDRLGGAY